MSSQGRNFVKNVRGQAIASSPQRHRLRLPNLEQAMEYEDNAIDVRRHPGHVKTAESKQGRRSQPSSIRKQVRVIKD